MKYINMSGAYLKDSYKDIIKINTIDTDITNIRVDFDMKHIAVLKGYYFKPTSKDEKEVEYANKKQYKGEFTKVLVADTDINVLTEFMERDMYKNIDLTAIIRYSDIEPMLNLIKNEKIKYLRKNKKNFISNLFNKSKKACILFINYEKRERVFEYIEYDSEENEDFFLEYSKKDFVPALMLSKEEVLDINEKIQALKKKDLLCSGDDLFINPRSSYEEVISDEDIELICNTMSRTLYSMNDTIREVKEENKNKEEVEKLINILKEHTIKVLDNDIKSIEFENERTKDIYPSMTFNYITLARHSKNEIDDLFSFLEQKELKNKELLKYKNNVSELVI